MKLQLSAGECKWGQCKCKNARGTRCGLCAQQGTLYCHLHQWCSDPANIGVERDGWRAPFTAAFQSQTPVTQNPQINMLSAASKASQTLQQPIPAVVQAVSNVTDFFVPYIVSDVCDSEIIKLFNKPLYTASQVETIYNHEKKYNPKMLHSLEDIIKCLKRKRKIGNTFISKKNNSDVSDYIDTLQRISPVGPLTTIVEAATKIAAIPLVSLAQSVIPSRTTSSNRELQPSAPFVQLPTAPFVPSLTSTLSSSLQPSANAGKLLEEIASIPSATAQVISDVVIETAPPPPAPESVEIETAPPPPAPTPLGLLRNLLFVGSFFPPPSQNNNVVFDPSIVNQSAVPLQIPNGYMWDYTNNKLVIDPGAFWDNRRFG